MWKTRWVLPWIKPDVNSSSANGLVEPSLDGDAASDDKVAVAKAKLANAFHYVETYEEAKLVNKSKEGATFVKVYEGEHKEAMWKNDHYFQGTEDSGVLLTSYQLDERRAEFEEYEQLKTSPSSRFRFVMGDGESNDAGQPSSTYWIKFEQPPEVPKVERGHPIFDVLIDFKEKNPEHFKDCEDPTNVLDKLSPRHLQGAEKDVLDFAADYWEKAAARQQLQPILAQLWNRAGIDDDTELVWGFGHVRKEFPSKRKKEPIMKLINSPLVEVVVRVVKLEDGSRSLVVLPSEDSRVKWNVEAKSVLLTTVGGNKTVVSDLHELVAKGTPKSLLPGSPVSYRKFLEKAKDLCWNSSFKESNDPSIHEPPDVSESMVVTGGWCLYLRPKRSTVCSRDAHAIKWGLENGTLELSAPLYSLVHGSKVQAQERNVAIEAEFDLPLATSASQLNAIDKVFKERHPTFVLQGPPGTGKTTTGVNMASIALQQDKSVLITSLNSNALRGFVKNIHPKLQMFCLDMSILEEDEGGGPAFCRALGKMEYDYSALKEKESDIEKDLQRCNGELDDKKRALDETEASLKAGADVYRRLMGNITFRNQVTRAREKGYDSPFVVICALRMGNLDAVSDELTAILDLQAKERQENVPFRCPGLVDVSPDLVEYVTEKACKSSAETQADTSTRIVPLLASKFINSEVDTRRSIQADLECLQIGEPQIKIEALTRNGWDRALRGLTFMQRRNKFHKEYLSQLLQYGCPRTQIYTETELINENAKEVVRQVKEWKNALVDVSAEDQMRLLESLSFICNHRKAQVRSRQLADEIQELEAEKVALSILLKKCKSLSAYEHGQLHKLAKAATKLTNETRISPRNGGRGLSHRTQFAETFQAILGFVPLLVMTAEQVMEFTKPNYRFGLCITEEASALDCNGLNLLARAEQVVIIGDDKQVSPTEMEWSDESIVALKATLPDIPPADQLTPGNSFFDICKVAFPGSGGILMDHFRCPPDGISWSSDNIYHGKIKTFKPSGGVKSKLHEFVKGIWDKNAKTNEVEAEAVVDYVIERIEREVSVVDPDKVSSIYVVSMAGRKHRNFIKALLEEKIDKLYLRYGRKIVDRHNIKVGESDELQGGERDIVVLSAGYDAKSVATETRPEHLRLWNVATTRHKSLNVLFHSYEIAHIKNKNDHKREIFASFIDAHNSSKSIDWDMEPVRPGNTRGMLEKRLASSLTSSGFAVCRNEGNIWGNSLCVSQKRNESSTRSAFALLYLENFGESEDEWATTVEQQKGLETAGTPCLRVDSLLLLLSFDQVLNDIVEFLKEEKVVAGTTEDRGMVDATTVAKPDGAAITGRVSDPSDSDSSSEVAPKKKEQQRKRRRKKETTTTASAKKRS